MDKRPTVGIGILSWRGYDSLQATLDSYRAQDMFSLFDESLLFLPEIEAAGIKIAQSFNLPYAGSQNNLGILGGFRALAEAMNSDYVLLLENDFQLTQTQSDTNKQLTRALKALHERKADVWRFRHLRSPGEPFRLFKVERYWPSPNALWEKRFMSRLRRLIRPGKARRMIGSTVFNYEDPSQHFPKYIQRTSEGDFIVSSKVINWSNNCFLINRQFFLNIIIPAALERQGKRLINGFPNIEIELNCPWWREQNFRIGFSNPGLFTHLRLNDRGY